MKPWTTVQVVKRIKGAGGVFLILQNLDPGSSQNYWFLCCKSLPRHVKDGAIVSVRKKLLSYFDLASMTPKEQEFRRIKTATAFIRDIAASHPLAP